MINFMRNKIKLLNVFQVFIIMSTVNNINSDKSRVLGLIPRDCLGCNDRWECRALRGELEDVSVY